MIGMILSVLLLDVGCRSPSTSAPVLSQARPAHEFSIITLNIAHGRNQMLQRTAPIRRNLDDIARLLTQTAPDIVSLHLDFSRGSVREKQIRHLVQHLKNINGPLIIMGDFNCQWPKRDGPLKTLACELNLHAYRPESKTLKTFPVFKTRLDWILISHNLRFTQYEVLPERLSDPYATILLN